MKYILIAFLSVYSLQGQIQVKSKTELEQIRKEKVNQQLEILKKESDIDKKQRALQALQFVAHDESIDQIASFLQDPQLQGAAARTLTAIFPYAKEKVATILSATLQKEKSTNFSLIQALISTGNVKVVPVLEKAYPQKDIRSNELILQGLAQFAQPSSKAILQQAAANVQYKFDASQALEAYVSYLKNTKSVSDLITLSKSSALTSSYRSLIANVLVELSAKPVVTAWEQFTSLDKVSSQATLNKMVRTAGKADWSLFATKFNQLSVAKQVDLLDAIAANRSKEASIFLSTIQSKNTHVRTSLANALISVSKESAFAKVWNLLKDGNLDGVSVGQSLKNIAVNNQLKQQVGSFDRLSSQQQAALLLYAASRKWESVSSYMWNAIQSNQSNRLAGFLALLDLAKVQDFEIIAGKLGQTDVEAEISSLQTCVGNFLKTNPELGSKLHGFASKSAHAINYISFLNELESLSLVYQLAKKSKSEEAIKAYVRINAKSLNSTQQLLHYRNALALTSNPSLKEDIYKRMLKCPSLATLRVLKDGVKEVAGKSAIADGMATMFISNPEIQSQMTKEWLQEVMPFISTAELKNDLTKEFAKTAGKTGFYSMFNGKDLTGWKGLVENPVKRRLMHPDTLAKKQIKADESMRKGWFAKEGELHFTGHGENLCSIKDYQDFEMFIDWKIESMGDAGIYLRGSPQVQIWDVANLRVGAQVGSGGLYNNQKNPSKPSKVADNPIEEWNSFRIIMKGERVTVYLNGELVVDNVVLENYWDRKIPIFVKDAIELQAHGDHIIYRDIYVKELDSQTLYEVSKEEKEQGFEALFDGQSLFQWTGNTVDYVPENGDLVIYPKRGGKGNIYTKKEYSNFHLKFEFKLTPGANNGLGIRTPMEGDAAYVGMELQILDNTAKVYEKLQPYQYHGSVYGIIPAKRDYLKPVGEWNYQEVIAQGNRIQVILNGETILDGDLAEATKNGTADHKEHPGLFNKTGHIGFLGHGSELRFRNIRIKELSEVEKTKKSKNKK